MKYIISFTTSPKRIHKCEPMLKSIINQSKPADLIILNIPKVFARTGENYDIPQLVSQNCMVNIVDIDYGPATKIIPTIKYLNENYYDKDDTRIIYLDDDIKYLEKMIEEYHRASHDNEDIWCAAGFNFYNFDIIGEWEHGKICSIAEGFGGVCVKLSCFEDDFLNYINKYINNLDIRLSDDVLISNYYNLKCKTIKILCVPGHYSREDITLNFCVLEYGNQSDALHNGADNISESNTARYKKVIHKFNLLKSRFFPLYFKVGNEVTVK